MSRKNRQSWLLALALLSPLTAWCSVAPDWMRQAAAKPPGTYPPDTNAVVLLDDATANVTAPGEMEFSLRRVVRILRPEGRKEGKLSVYLGEATNFTVFMPGQSIAMAANTKSRTRNSWR